MSLRTRIARCESALTIDRWAAAMEFLKSGTLPESKRDQSTTIDIARAIALVHVADTVPCGLGGDDEQVLVRELLAEAEASDERDGDSLPRHVAIVTDTHAGLGAEVATKLVVAGPDEAEFPALFPSGRYRGVVRFRTAVSLEIGDVADAAWELASMSDPDCGRIVMRIGETTRFDVVAT